MNFKKFKKNMQNINLEEVRKTIKEIEKCKIKICLI